MVALYNFMGSSVFKQERIAHRALCLLLSAALAITMTILPTTAFAADSASGIVRVQASASLPNVTARSQADIKAFLKSHPFSRYGVLPEYAIEPSAKSPYSAGQLSSKSANEALNALNMMRYVAGLDSNVTLDATYAAKAQAGSMLNAVTGVLSHAPAKPADMPQSLYDLGYSGCQSSNISSGAWNPAGSILMYMNDSDSSNIDRVGHRRWILNPAMGKTGFGMCDAISATYAFDTSNSSAWQTNVVWPAQNMPLDYFNEYQAWSISTGSLLDGDKVQVTLTKKASGRQWHFSKQSADGDFYVENTSYGQTGCVIFRPSDLGELKEGDEFRVQVTGIPQELDYTVSFFRADPLSAYVLVDFVITGTSFVYNGDWQMPVIPPGGCDASGTWFAVNPGTYTCTFTLQKGYLWSDGTSAPKTIKWTIKAASSSTTAKPSSSTAKVKKPAATSLKSVKAGKKKATIKWKKQTKNVSGYQVWLSTSKKFTKKTTVKKTVSKKKTSLTVKKLKAKKTYYVKIRTYYQNPTTKKKTYSNWSKVKRVTIKK